MQKSSISLVVNLIGLQEAIFNILGYHDNKEGRAILHKVVETAVDVAAKKGKELGDGVAITMTESDGSARFATLDGEKYGKNSVLKSLESRVYSEGIILEASEIQELTPKSDKIAECNKIAKILDGGLLTRFKISKVAKPEEVKQAIEKVSELTSSFKPIKQVPICGNCGFKDEKLGEKCPSCKSPYIIS